MRENHIRILCRVLKVDMVYEAADGTLTAFFDNIAESPLMQSANLRRILREGTAAQTAPFLRKNDFDSYFAGIAADGGFLFMGPMPHQRLNSMQRRQMYKSYGIASDGAPIRTVFTLPEIRDMILLTNTVLENNSLENEELLQLNRIINRNDLAVKQEQTQQLLAEEEENDDSAFRHSYHDEQLLMQAIREGRATDAVRLAERMDGDAGRLSREDLRHRLNLAIVGIALCARAAIDGGISPETAYRLSGYYIKKCDEAQDPAHMLHHRNRAIEELAGRVAEKLQKPRASGYVEKSRDYVRKHYREKIYLEDIAASIGVSPTYLSRLFKKETGTCLQDFINEERVFRAANLLLYSDLPLPEIAHYVGFPNQSYMGKIFKKLKNMTPRAYRDAFANREADLA